MRRGTGISGFNTEGFCNPTENYMVALDSRLEKIKRLVDDGKYFSINCARQYGKTTVLNALEQNLQRDYQVISLDFQLLSYADFVRKKDFISRSFFRSRKIVSCE